MKNSYGVVLLLSVFILISSLFTSCTPDVSMVKEGDIIFQTSQLPQHKMIQLITHSAWNHCGLVLADSTKNLVVLEAEQTVKEIPLKEWVSKGEKKHFVVFRLKNSGSILTKGILSKMKKITSWFLGKSADDQFNWSDDEMYGAELVYKVYFLTTGIKLAETKPLKSFDLSSVDVKEKLQDKFKGKIPVNEPVLFPQQLLESTWLTKISEH